MPTDTEIRATDVPRQSQDGSLAKPTVNPLLDEIKRLRKKGFTIRTIAARLEISAAFVADRLGEPWEGKGWGQ